MNERRTAAPLQEERRRQPPPPDSSSGGLPLSAKLYLGAAYGIAGAVAVSAVTLGSWNVSQRGIVAFGVLAGLATIAQLFVVKAPNRHSYQTTPAFLLTAALLLQPGLLAPLVLVALIPEWLRYRYPWYIQTFNMATYLLNSLAAWAVFNALAPHGLAVSWSVAGAVAAAALAFAMLNHLMVALVLWLARGIPVTASGVASLESLETDLALLGVGTGIAVLWTVEPYLIVLELVPLFLFYRALYVPQLQDEAHHDAKTGLLSARRFMELLNDELGRAAKSGRALAVVMTDLDLFRNVNNTLGHLAGDEVLHAVAQVMKKTLRKDDVIGRFGGEEFVILLRNTDNPGAARAAERLRAAVQSAAVKVTDSPDPVHITLSLGVAAFPSPCPDTSDLMRLADLAVYRSKLNGRNQVTMATPDMAEENPASDQSYHAILKSLAFAVNTRGAVVGEHILRITSITLATARELGVEEGSAEWMSIEQAGLLHDVGNLAISSTVLYKNGPLSDEEWEEMQMHPEIGWSMLRQVELLKPAAEIVRAHHEHYDGSGYPRGLSVDDIPLGARILAVVDAFDAITSGRPYRAARPEPEALQEIVRNRGTQFDPRVIDAFLRALGGEQVPAAVRPAA